VELEDESRPIKIEPAESDIAILESLSGQYCDVYNEIEALDLKIKDLKKSKENIIQTFVEKCNEAGLDGIKTPRGSFAPVIEECIGVKKENEEKIFAHLESVGLGASIRRSVHFQTLNKHYRDGELAMTEEVEELFTLWERKKIRMRRNK
jgi:hypothetical protein